MKIPQTTSKPKRDHVVSMRNITYTQRAHRTRLEGSERVLSALFQLCMGFILLSVVTACSDAHLCVPGKVERCPCLPSGNGVQRCAEDGARFLPCECSSPIPQLEVAFPSSRALSSTTQSSAQPIKSLQSSTSLNSERLTPNTKGLEAKSRAKQRDPKPNKVREKAAQRPTQRPRSSETPDDSSSPFKARRAQLVALEMKIEDSDARASTLQSKGASGGQVFKQNLRNQQRNWWFYSSALKRCVLTEHDKRGSRTPLRLISDGCYRHLENKEEIVVRCEDPPLGPSTYHFTRSVELCRTRQRESLTKAQVNSKERPKPRIAALAPVIAESPGSSGATSLGAQPQRRLTRSWHCLCYQERVQGVPTHATACRPTKEMCIDLANKVKRGSSILVPGSLSVSCQERKGPAPWKTFQKRGSNRALWRPSSHPGAWWSPGGCYLPGGPAILNSAQVRTSNSKRSNTAQTSTRVSSKRASGTQQQRPQRRGKAARLSPQDLARFGSRGSAPRAARCVESCRANLVSSSMRQHLYGVRDVPKALRWGSKHADRVKFIKTTCLRTQPQGQRNEQICVDQVIQKCARYCERAG